MKRSRGAGTGLAAALLLSVLTAVVWLPSEAPRAMQESLPNRAKLPRCSRPSAHPLNSKAASR